MARVVAFIPDLMFGSTVLVQLEAAGHEVALVADVQRTRELVAGADVLVVDLTSDAGERIEAVGALRSERALAGVATLAFYSHVEAAVRRRAQDEGFDLVVPRSRMAREGSTLVSRLAGGDAIRTAGGSGRRTPGARRASGGGSRT